MFLTRFVFYSVLYLALSACGGSSDSDLATPPVTEEPVIQPPAGLPVPDNSISSHYQILLVGNSHVRSNDLAGLIGQLIQAGPKKAGVYVKTAERISFLDDRINDQITLPTIKERAWTHIILQGQKYSTTGAYTYPIDAALYWLRTAKSLNATPVLFPEHPRFQNHEEGQRVFALHQSIARLEPACVAPVGPAWDTMTASWQEVQLHQPDGNHAALAGSLLTALLFYQIITGDSADTLGPLANIGIPAQQQQWLRQTASAALQGYPACDYK
jgi:hypothetical protein